jgi:hypothetical protein
MSRHLLVPLIALAALAACADRDLPTTPLASQPADTPNGVSTARERLAARLAVALADPTTRREVVERFAASTAPEGKLQFQALMRADGSRLLARLASSGATSVTELVADLDAARGLELYLPVAEHRAAWLGDAHFLVGTIGQDGEVPVAFDAAGNRSILHRDRPPTTPVIALVPQEFDFTGGRPHLALSCWTYCGGGEAWGGGGGGAGSASTQGGLFLTKSHFEEEFESWIKGKPEFEYHVYGQDPKGGSIQLSCVGEHAGGPYAWDQNTLDWSGAVPLLSESDRENYEAMMPGGVVRIVAWEDDDEPCVVRTDGGGLATLLRDLDAFYRKWTSGKLEPTILRGIKAAPSAFDLAKSVRNFITTADDFVGNAVETSIAGWGPGGANWLLKTEGARTTGWFVTEYRR